MKITFIRPAMVSGVPHDSLEPLVFAILSSLTPSDVERTLYDDRFETVPLDQPTDLVAMTVETYTARRAYQIALEYRKRGVPVVLGGVHPTLVPDEVLQFATSVVVGDAEGVWARVDADAARGELQPRYESRFPPLSGISIDRSVFSGKRYVKIPLVQFGRGCRFACDFCSINYDHDTPDSFDRCVEFALRAKFLLCNFNLLNPNPGAPVYNRFDGEGRLVYDKWWLHPDFRFGQAVFKPARMTPEELAAGCFEAREKFNRYSSILTRALDLKANLRSLPRAALYFGAHLAARGEIYRKQGLPLGDPKGQAVHAGATPVQPLKVT